MIVSENRNGSRNLLVAVAFCGAVLSVARPKTACSADSKKTFANELAANKPTVQIFTSGARALEFGRAFQSMILSQGKSRKNASEVQVLLGSVGAGALRPRATIILMMIGQEMSGPLPLALSGFLPGDLKDPKTKLSALESAIKSDEKKAGAFVITLFAPDASRFQRVFDAFTAKQFTGFREMAVRERYQTNKLALFSSPENRALCEGWGQSSSGNVWNTTEWHSLAERDTLSPAQLDECHQVYFIDRSSGDPVPSVVSSAFAGQSIKPTTLLMGQTKDANGCSLVVFNAPSHLMLEAKVKGISNVQAVPAGWVTEEAIDLRSIASTTLLVTGEGVASEEQREQIRLVLAKDMRSDLHMDVEERGKEFFRTLKSEITLQQLQGATDTARKLRRVTGLRHMWLFSLTQFDGATEYKTSEAPLTSAPDSAFSLPEPVEPEAGHTQKRKVAARNMRERETWEREHAEWQRQKEMHESAVTNAPIQWQRSVTQVSEGHARGILRLIDLDDRGKVLWEQECSATARDAGDYKSDHTTMRGDGNRPESLDAPAATNSCPADLMYQAARQAGQDGLTALRSKAWLPEKGNSSRLISQQPANLSGESSPTDPPSTNPRPNVAAPQVAAVEGSVITLTVGARQGIRVGDWVVLALKTKQILHPGTGAVLEERISERMKLRVDRVSDVTADCTPALPEDSAKLPQVMVGTNVEKWFRMQPSPSRKPKTGR